VEVRQKTGPAPGTGKKKKKKKKRKTKGKKKTQNRKKRLKGIGARGVKPDNTEKRLGEGKGTARYQVTRGRTGRRVERMCSSRKWGWWYRREKKVNPCGQRAQKKKSN